MTNEISLENIFQYNYEIVLKDISQDVTTILKSDWKNQSTLIGDTTPAARTILYRPNQLSQYVFKVYNKPCDPYNPLSHVLRVPMAHLVNKCIQFYKLTWLESIQKALAPLHEFKVTDNMNAEDITRTSTVSHFMSRI